MLVLKASEVETDYGHVLVFGVNEEMTSRFDFANVTLPAQEVIDEVARMGGVAVPCHPGRPNVGLCEHYDEEAAARERGRGRGAQWRIAQGRGRTQRRTGASRYGYRRGRRLRQPSGEPDRTVRRRASTPRSARSKTWCAN